MESTELIIKIGIFETLGIIVTVCGSIVGAAWYASGKFSRTETSIEGLDTRLTNIESYINDVTKTASPISLTEKGNKALQDSGLKDFIDKNKEAFILECQKNHNMKSDYDIQISAFKYFDNIFFGDEFDKKIKDYAFNNGLNMDVMRRIGGIYYRDICLEELKKKK
jgi:hypothetical protein